MANYATRSEADAYFANKYGCARWGNTPTSEREQVLALATNDIDALAYKGMKAAAWTVMDTGGTGEETSLDYTLREEAIAAGALQANQFPRNSDTVVPQDIKDACCEIAYQYICGKNPETAYEALSTAAQSYAGARITYDREAISAHVRAGIISIRAWRLLRPYLAEQTTVTLRRAD